MKPDFALSLSFDGISLLAREGANWRAIDRVALDSPDLTTALAGMRRKAEDTSASRVLSKLLIPEAQIRFMDLDLPAQGDPAEVVRAALHGATPYAVDDLVWDWGIAGDRIKVAAVARETLDEAEDFARTNGFNPVSFAAANGVGGLGTEVFFGPTRLAATLLAPWQQVKRDGPAPVQALPSAKGDETVETATNGAPVTPVNAAPDATEARAEESDTEQAAPETSAPAPETPEPEDAPVCPAMSESETDAGAAEPKADDTLPVFTQGHPDGPPNGHGEGGAPSPADHAPDPARTPSVVSGDASAPVFSHASRSEDAADPAPQAADVASDEAAPVFTHAAGDAPVKGAPDAPSGAPADPSPEAESPVDRSPKPPLAAPAVQPPAPQSPAPKAPAPSAPMFGSTRTRGAALSATPPAPDLPTGSFQSIRATRGDETGEASPRLDGASRGSISAPGIPIPGFRAKPDPVPDDDLPPKPAPAIIRDHRNGADSAPAPRANGADHATGVAADGPRDANAPDSGNSAGDDRKAAVASNLGRILQRSRATRADSLPPEAHAPVTETPDDTEAPASRMKRLMARRNSAAARDTDPETIARRQQHEAERERMTVFGARRNEKAQIGGKPRFLGFMLTLVLLLFMAAVAALASTFGEQIVALFRAPEEPVTVSQPAPEILPEAPAEAEPTVSGPQIELTAVEPSSDSAPATPDVQALRQPAPQPSQAVTPEAAQARYAATGIWPAAPDAPMPPRISLQEQLQVAAIDPSLGLPRLPERPGVGTAPSADDSGILVQAPPPPGVIYDLDERGMIVPTREGIVTPDRFLLVAGRPPVTPPYRAAVDPETGDVTRASLAQPEVIDPGIVPRIRPEGLAPEVPETETAAPQETPEAAPTTPEAPEAIATEEQPAPAPEPVPFEGPTPPVRPAALASLAPLGQAEAAAPPAPEATPEAAEAPSLPPFDGPRPQLRPASLAERAAAQTPAAPSPEAVPEPEAEAAPAQDSFLNATNQAVAASLVPSGRPSNFARQVARAEEQAAQAPAPQVAQVQVAPRTVRQSAPTTASVSTQATVRNAINLTRVNLIGVYGKPASRRALVRLPNGRYQKVKVGDRIDGGRVAAIGDSELQYTKNGRSVTLKMPRS